MLYWQIKNEWHEHLPTHVQQLFPVDPNTIPYWVWHQRNMPELQPSLAEIAQSLPFELDEEFLDYFTAMINGCKEQAADDEKTLALRCT